MKTVANLFATTHAVLGADQQKDRHFITIERYPPDDDGFCSFVKSVEGLAQNEYWIAREKNILMLLKKTPYVVRLRKEEEKTESSYQTVKTKDAGITLAHWLRTKPTIEAYHQPLKHPFENVGAFLSLAKHCILALKNIHQAGVIHANLRPDNICIPYAPCPYEFNTELKIDYENLALIDFMFAISSTLKLSRPLPILSSPIPSTQSTLLINALDEDRKNRNTDRSQRIDYSVDLYALGFILDQIFQQDLAYPDHLHAELSMEIHNFIAELKNYDNGVPDAVKMKYLHLLPHDGYLKHLDYLLSLDIKAINADAQLLTLDPAQFLEDDLLFPSDTGLLDAETVTMTVDNNSNNGISNNTLSESYEEGSYMEINKGIVISLIITFQAMFFIYTAGDELSLDILPSLLLTLAIGLAIAAGIFVMSPRAATKPQSSLLDIPTLEANPASAKAAPVLVANSAALFMNSDDDSVPAPQVHETQTHEAHVQPAHTKTEEVEDPASYVELDKGIVITLLITGQVMFFTYTEGDNLNLDILSSMSLILVIGVLFACATKLFTPKAMPKYRPIIIEPTTPVTDVPAFDIVAPAPSVTPAVIMPETMVPAVSPAAVTIASFAAVPVLDEPVIEAAPIINEPIVAAAPLLEEELVTLNVPVHPEPVVADESAMLNEPVATVAEIAVEVVSEPLVAVTPAPVVELIKPTPVVEAPAAPETVKGEDKDDSMELNKWAVIAAIVAFQVGYFLLTTDFHEGETPAPVAAVATTETPVEATAPTTETAPEAPPADSMTTEAAPPETTPRDEAAAANIALLNEATSVKTPEVAAVKSKKDRAEDSVLLSGTGASSVSRVSKEKPAKKTAVTPSVATPDAAGSDMAIASDTAAAPTDTKTATAPVAATSPAANTAKKDAVPVEEKAEAKPAPKSITRGLAEAQNIMGVHYYQGDGVPRDYEESFKWFQKAANLGEPSAQFNVGMMYAAGTGTKQDFAEAARWYRKAAEQGKISAQLNLGMMYISGRGIRQNLPEGVKWLTKAADQGDMTAKANLAWLSQQGYVQAAIIAAPAAASDSSAPADANK